MLNRNVEFKARVKHRLVKTFPVLSVGKVCSIRQGESTVGVRVECHIGFLLVRGKVEWMGETS
jgi:hypothetical protein